MSTSKGSPKGKTLAPDDPTRGEIFRALVFATVGLILIQLSQPPTMRQMMFMVPLAAVFGIAGAISGYRTRKRCRARRIHLPGPMVALVIGVVTVVITAATAFSFAVIPEYRHYSDCLIGANTEVSRELCDTSFRDALTRRMNPAGR